MEKIKSVLEKAAARIGCPPGDNADADLYHEILAALSALEGSKPKELTDEEIERMLIDVEVVLRESMELASPVARMVELDRYRTCLKQLRGMGYLSPQPKEPPRYVMSGLAEEAMEVRHEFAAFILNHYGVTNHAELRTHIDSLLIMFDQLVEQPKELTEINRHLDVAIKVLTRSTKTATDAGYDMPRDWMDSSEKRRELAGIALSATLAIKKCLPPLHKEQGAEPVAERSLDAGELAVQFNAITAHETCVHCDDGEIGPEVCQFCHGHGSVPPHEQVIKDRVRRLFVNYRSAPTSREKAMEVAGDAMDELLDGPWHIYDENREKAISAWRTAKSTK